MQITMEASPLPIPSRRAGDPLCRLLVVIPRNKLLVGLLGLAVNDEFNYRTVSR